MSEEKFCLKWNDFESNISSSFRDLREAKDLFDLTLLCGEFHQFQAHKVILSASSPFFRRVLCQNPHNNNPMIYLRGISPSDLQYILDFIYYGEVNVSQDNLNSFLAVAEDLKIKGLTQGQNDSKPKPTPNNCQPRKNVYKTSKQLSDYAENTKNNPPPDDDIVEVPVRVKNEVAEAEDQSVALEQDYSGGGGFGGDTMVYDGDAGGYEEMGAGALQDYGGDKGQF